MENKVSINVVINWNEYSKVRYELHRYQPFLDLMENFATRQNAPVKTLHFLYKDRQIVNSDTPNHLDIKEGDTILVLTPSAFSFFSIFSNIDW